MKTKLHWLVWLVGVIAITGHAIYLVEYSQNPDQSGANPASWGFLAAVLGWTAVPYIVVGSGASRFRESLGAVITLLVTAVLILAVDVYLKWSILSERPDPRSGLVFVFMPFWELVPAVLGLSFAFIFLVAKRPKNTRAA